MRSITANTLSFGELYLFCPMLAVIGQVHNCLIHSNSTCVWSSMSSSKWRAWLCTVSFWWSLGIATKIFVNLKISGQKLWAFFVVDVDPLIPTVPCEYSEDGQWSRIITLQAYNAVNNLYFKLDPAQGGYKRNFNTQIIFNGYCQKIVRTQLLPRIPIPFTKCMRNYSLNKHRKVTNCCSMKWTMIYGYHKSLIRWVLFKVDLTYIFLINFLPVQRTWSLFQLKEHVTCPLLFFFFFNKKRGS